MSRNLDETVRLQSEKRHKRIREIRGERLMGLQRAQVALRLASSPSGRTRKDGGEDRVARTERESDSKGREEKWQACWCAETS